jgi:DNA repair protein RadD
MLQATDNAFAVVGNINIEEDMDTSVVVPNKKPKRAAKVEESPKWLKVQSRKFFSHVNDRGSESVRIDYMANSVSYRMWLSICNAKIRSDKYWSIHGGNEPYPADVSEWLARQDELNGTNEIQVRPKGRYFEIVGIKPAQKHQAAT